MVYSKLLKVAINIWLMTFRIPHHNVIDNVAKYDRIDSFQQTLLTMYGSRWQSESFLLLTCICFYLSIQRENFDDYFQSEDGVCIDVLDYFGRFTLVEISQDDLWCEISEEMLNHIYLARQEKIGSCNIHFSPHWPFSSQQMHPYLLYCTKRLHILV